MSDVSRERVLSRLQEEYGDVEEWKNDSPFLADLKAAIVEYNNTFVLSGKKPMDYGEFGEAYGDLHNVKLLFPGSVKQDGYLSLDLHDLSWTRVVEGKENGRGTFFFEPEDGKDSELVKEMSPHFLAEFIREIISARGAQKLLEMQSQDYALYLKRSFYDPLSLDTDLDGVPDRFDTEFRDSRVSYEGQRESIHEKIDRLSNEEVRPERQPYEELSL